MKLDTLFGLAIGVGFGYIIAKKLDDLPTLIQNKKALSAREAITAAYNLGAMDGKEGKTYSGTDVIAYLQTAR